MQLSLHADYALRILIYLGTHPGRLVTTQEISSAYGVSKHHLVRVIHTLAGHKYVAIQPGRSGGVVLSRDPHLIRLGDVVRAAEPNLRLVECFDAKTNTCPITSVCSLKGMLKEALTSFLDTLNQYTVADVLDRGGQRKLAGVFVNIASVNADPRRPSTSGPVHKESTRRSKAASKRDSPAPSPWKRSSSPAAKATPGEGRPPRPE